jgi:secreted trypsin-like serine protease
MTHLVVDSDESAQGVEVKHSTGDTSFDHPSCIKTPPHSSPPRNAPTKYAPTAFVGATLVVAIIASFVLLAARNKSDGAREHSSSIQELQRIIGGYEAVEDRYSYAVSLQGPLGHFCGGSLIARDVILTAAHCQGMAQSAVLGRHDLDEYFDGEVFAIRAELPHPEYNEILHNNDFMLIFLEGHSTAEDIVPVRLNSDPSVPAAGRDVTVVGWGDTDISEVEDMSDVLMKVVVSVVPNDECDAVEGSGYTYRGQITKSMLCAWADGRDSCQGDSGGALVIRGGSGRSDVQVGIVSWGAGCAFKRFPGIYARVSQAYHWIQRDVCMGSVHASEAGFDCSGGGTYDVSVPSSPPPTSPPITASNDGISIAFGIIDVDSSLGDSGRDGKDDDEPT